MVISVLLLGTFVLIPWTLGLFASVVILAVSYAIGYIIIRALSVWKIFHFSAREAIRGVLFHCLLELDGFGSGSPDVTADVELVVGGSRSHDLDAVRDESRMKTK